MNAIMIPAALWWWLSGWVRRPTRQGLSQRRVRGGVAGHCLATMAGSERAPAIIGHHEAAKRERARERAYREGYGSSAPYDRGYDYSRYGGVFWLEGSSESVGAACRLGPGGGQPVS